MGMLTVLIQQNAWEELEAALESSPRARSELVGSDRLGRIPLHYLCAKKRAPARIVSVVLKRMASRTTHHQRDDILFRVDIGGNTILQAAAMGGNSAVVQVLLTEISRVTGKEDLAVMRVLSRVNDSGMTPLFMAWRKFFDPSFSLFGHRTAVGAMSAITTERYRQILDIESGTETFQSMNEPLRDLWWKTEMLCQWHCRDGLNKYSDGVPWRCTTSLCELIRVGGQRTVQCPTVAFWIALQLRASETQERDTDGHLPIHLAARYPEFAELPLRDGPDDNVCVGTAMAAVNEPILTQLARQSPETALCRIGDDRLALHVAIVNGKDWHRGVYALVRAAPTTLERRDAKSKLYPFLLAASSPSASLTLTFELLRARPDLIKVGLDAGHPLPRKKPRCSY